jgi:serine/threonine protein kinase
MPSTSGAPPNLFLMSLLNLIKTPDENLDKLAELCHVTGNEVADQSSWRDILRQIPLDSRSFREQYGSIKSTEVVDALRNWHTYFQEQDPVRKKNEYLFGFLGVVLLTLVAVSESERRRYRSSTDEDSNRSSESHDCRQLCSPLVQDAAVRAVLQIVYSPERQDANAKMWKDIDFTTLEFHRHGTTSIIMRCDRKNQEPAALKLITYPFLRIQLIREATKRYSVEHDIVRIPDNHKDHLVQVDASTEAWVLMEFIEGATVAEELSNSPPSEPLPKSRRWLLNQLVDRGQRGRLSWLPQKWYAVMYQLFDPERPSDDRLDLIRLKQMGLALFQALNQLEQIQFHQNGRVPATHDDLSPSNIIAQHQDGTWHFVLIDQGRNYLYSHSVTGGSEGGDALYVAPEIKEDSEDASRADVYSVGRLLITMAGVAHRPDGTVPDAFYDRVPFLARFIEDLIDQDPDKRLVVYCARHPKKKGDPSLWKTLERFFVDEVDAVIAASDQKSKGWSSRKEILSPLGGALRRQRKLVEVVSRQETYLDPRRGRRLKHLMRWARFSAGLSGLAFGVVIWWLLRDAGWNWGNVPLELVQRIFEGRLTGTSSGGFPVVDSLRRPGYNVPDLDHNWPARIIGLSYLLAGVKYYENIASGVSPLAVGPGSGMLTWRARVAETGIRMLSFTAPVLVLTANLVDVRWWPIASAIGQTVIFYANWAGITFVSACLSRARKLKMSTVSPDNGMVTGFKQYAQWVPSSFFYAVVVWGIGSMIVTHHLRDVWLYACLVAAVNVVLFYIIKCGMSASDVRITLQRAVLAGERAGHIERAAKLDRVAAQPAAVRTATRSSRDGGSTTLP